MIPRKDQTHTFKYAINIIQILYMRHKFEDGWRAGVAGVARRSRSVSVLTLISHLNVPARF